MNHEFRRIQRLPPYVFNEVNDLKQDARRRGEDIIDFGLGNPDQATPDHIVEYIVENTVGEAERASQEIVRKLTESLGDDNGPFAEILGRFDPATEGNVIDMGFSQFQVVEACNGLRFVLPLFCLGVIFAFYRPMIWWKRLFLIVITVPLAVGTNVVRIAGTGILAHYFGVDVAQGFFHDFSGWAVNGSMVRLS